MKGRYDFIIVVGKASGRFHTSRMTLDGNRRGPVAVDETAQGSLDHFVSRMKYWKNEEFIVK